MREAQQFETESDISRLPAKVALAPCGSYSPAEIESALRNLLANIGGIERFVKPGQSVLLKPNLLSDKEPERAITTHPEVVRALSRIVKQAGGKPFVADSPANVVKIEKVWERTGFGAMCAEEGIPLVNLEVAGWENVTLANGFSVAVARPVLDADVIISVPKVKTHMLTIFTGAVKNIYGTVPGFHKTTLHKMFPTIPEFCRLLAGLYGKVRPHLSVADAVIGMEGEGPSAGSPIKLGFLAASADSAALDTIVCRILGINTRDVQYLGEVAKLNRGETDPGKIEVVGAEIAQLKPASFRTPSTLVGRLIPGRLVKLLQPYIWIRPSFMDTCVSCGRCVKACPAAALSMEKGKKPRLDPPKCVGCCCCHEICPQNAIEMRLSPFVSFFRRGRLP